MDRTRAKALEIAERKLISLGWRFSFEDVGKYADTIIAAMEKAEADRRRATATEGSDNG
ncbi:hypothetical protein [Rhizobium leguminosarum]|uniref:hypothetical protein n=1 Tax=Rhizobium leguminosarum TaxID=384 RepID=UPI001559C17A|nr:hypothetical protein [Rhizobium leguminosarum]